MKNKSYYDILQTNILHSENINKFKFSIKPIVKSIRLYRFRNKIKHIPIQKIKLLRTRTE